MMRSHSLLKPPDGNPLLRTALLHRWSMRRANICWEHRQVVPRLKRAEALRRPRYPGTSGWRPLATTRAMCSLSGAKNISFWASFIAALVALACYAMARGVIRELKAAQLQTDFVSAVSHEFRSPLTTLLQLTELLAHDRIHDEDRRRLYFDILHKETGRLHGLVENLLDFGRMEAGRTQYRPESIDLYELVRDRARLSGGDRRFRVWIRTDGHCWRSAARRPGSPSPAGSQPAGKCCSIRPSAERFGSKLDRKAAEQCCGSGSRHGNPPNWASSHFR